MLCVPIFFLWFFGTKPILGWLGIDPAIAEMSQNFTRIQVPYSRNPYGESLLQL